MEMFKLLVTIGCLMILIPRSTSLLSIAERIAADPFNVNDDTSMHEQLIEADNPQPDNMEEETKHQPLVVKYIIHINRLVADMMHEMEQNLAVFGDIVLPCWIKPNRERCYNTRDMGTDTDPMMMDEEMENVNGTEGETKQKTDGEVQETKEMVVKKEANAENRDIDNTNERAKEKELKEGYSQNDNSTEFEIEEITLTDEKQIESENGEAQKGIELVGERNGNPKNGDFQASNETATKNEGMSNNGEMQRTNETTKKMEINPDSAKKENETEITVGKYEKEQGKQMEHLMTTAISSEMSNNTRKDGNTTEEEMLEMMESSIHTSAIWYIAFLFLIVILISFSLSQGYWKKTEPEKAQPAFF